jgi:hypothetical protein
VNPNLVFVGAEFGLFFTTDGGTRWVQLKGEMPVAQVRDLDVQRRENDLVLGTFGRSFYVLDDYSALRGATAEALAQEAVILPLRHAYQFNTRGQVRATESDWNTPNPPYGAYLTYHLRDASANTEWVLSIADATGREVRRVDVPNRSGVGRVVWNLTAAPPVIATDPGTGGAGRGGAAGAGRGGAAGAGGGGRGGGGGGRGGGGGGTAVAPGRYSVSIGKVANGAFTAVGGSQQFNVVPLPARSVER